MSDKTQRSKKWTSRERPKSSPRSWFQKSQEFYISNKNSYCGNFFSVFKFRKAEGTRKQPFLWLATEKKTQESHIMPKTKKEPLQVCKILSPNRKLQKRKGIIQRIFFSKEVMPKAPNNHNKFNSNWIFLIVSSERISSFKSWRSKPVKNLSICQNSNLPIKSSITFQSESYPTGIITHKRCVVTIESVGRSNVRSKLIFFKKKQIAKLWPLKQQPFSTLITFALVFDIFKNLNFSGCVHF